MSDPHVLSYQRFLPPELTSPLVDPVTEWLPIGRCTTVHLFRHPAPESVPESAPERGAVVVLHGGGGHGRMLAGLGALVQRLGAGAVAPDLPGYGHTVVADRRSVTYDDWVDAAAAVVDHEYERTGSPVVVVGASMGGRLAVDVAHRLGDRVGAVVATCLLDPRLAEVRAVVGRHRLLVDGGVLLMRVTARFSDRIMVPMRWIAPIDRIANDPDLADICSHDPLGAGRAVPLGFLRTWLDYDPGYEPETFTACPVILAHPGDDRWTPLEVSRAWFDRLVVDRELIVLPGCGHFPVEPSGYEALATALRTALGLASTGPRNHIPGP